MNLKRFFYGVIGFTGAVFVVIFLLFFACIRLTVELFRRPFHK